VWLPRPDENPVLTALSVRGMYKAPLGVGKHGVSCPWVHEHTGELDNGTVYFEPDDNWAIGGFHYGPVTLNALKHGILCWFGAGIFGYLFRKNRGR